MRKGKFKPGDKLICKSDAYLTINKDDCVTVDKYVSDGYLYIEECVGIYEDMDFIKIK